MSDDTGFPMSPPPLLDDDDAYRAHRASEVHTSEVMSAKFHVWKGGLTGRYFAGSSAQQDDGSWVATGRKHDVTDDVEAIIAARLAERDAEGKS